MAPPNPRNALAKTAAVSSTAARSTADAASNTAHAVARAVTFVPTVAINAALSPSLTGLLLLILTTRGGPSLLRDLRARLERALGGTQMVRRSMRVERATTSHIRADCGDPTVLINNAGIAEQHAILEGNDEYDEQLFRVNVLSHFTLIREFLPGMLAQKKGHIITVASMASYYTPSGIVNYAASKAAVLSLHEGLNVELRHRYGPAGKHIITSIIHPSWTQTPIIDSWIASLKKSRAAITKPAEVAAKIVRQVLRAEPAQVFVPDRAALFSSFRGWPTWLQELLRDSGDRKTRPLGDDDGVKGKGRVGDVGYGVGEDRDAFGGSRSYDIVEG
ncbi:hypothetical protein SLS55_007947 [Diplodia seriata]|uniref:Uncharacterized protein n=1 Tax=Diplodia seriata TaxID=420778 RepID=A0ABR3C926_9PEZI